MTCLVCGGAVCGDAPASPQKAPRSLQDIQRDLDTLQRELAHLQAQEYLQQRTPESPTVAP